MIKKKIVHTHLDCYISHFDIYCIPHEKKLPLLQEKKKVSLYYKQLLMFV